MGNFLLEPPMKPSRPVSLVTGASAGIGAAFARALAARGHDLVLTARRADRLEALAIELREKHGAAVTVLPCDLADVAAPQNLVTALDERGLHIDWLVNNAGYGVPGALVDSPWRTHADSLQVLLTAPTELSRALLPGMRERGYGRIVNVASLAGFLPGTSGHTLYAATKSYLIKFSQSLALENKAAGVNVCALCPGFTRSEFHDVTGTRDKMNKLPDFMWLSAEEVVRQGIDAVERGDAVHVTGRLNSVIKAVFELIPDPLALALSAKQSRRYRNGHD
jgi:short-subunit dehydrogenase